MVYSRITNRSEIMKEEYTIQDDEEAFRLYVERIKNMLKNMCDHIEDDSIPLKGLTLLKAKLQARKLADS